MADIELVVKIPEEHYEMIQNIPNYVSEIAIQAVRDGIPLPKDNEDAIGREDMLDAIGHGTTYTSEELQRIIKGLPPVNPQPKTGHWIEHPEIKTSTPEYLMFYECSECGYKQCFSKSDIHKKHFCLNCGAKMVESQESEARNADSN